MKTMSVQKARKAYKEYCAIQAKIKEDISRSKVEWNAHARKVTLLTEALRYNKIYLRDTITDTALEIYDKEKWQKNCHRLSERVRLLRGELKREIEACKTSKQLYKIYCAQQSHLYPTSKKFEAIKEGERFVNIINHNAPRDKASEEKDRREAINSAIDVLDVVVQAFEGIKKAFSEPIDLDEEIKKNETPTKVL